MINSEEGQDRGRWLFNRYPGQITSILKKRKESYFKSAQYKALRHLCVNMDMYIDNNSPSVSSFISDITPPTIRRSYNEFSSLFYKFLENDPLFTVSNDTRAKIEQVHLIQSLINENIEKTYYRERSLIWTIDDIIRYGTAAVYSFATNDYNANSLMTVKSDVYGSYEQVYGKGEQAILSVPIHPLNVFIDPRGSFQSAPGFLGFIADICMSNISVLFDNPAYIQKNLKEAFEQAKKGIHEEFWYAGDDSELKDFSQGHTNICYFWTKLPFEGNEDDPRWYACETIMDKVIRIEENPLDGNTIPLAISRVFPRKYQWYGNSPLVDKICIQNMQYWLLNTTVESTARLMDRIVLYREGDFDIEAMNSRHTTGGFVPYSGQQQDLSKLVYGVPMQAVGFRENEWMMQEMRREDQETSMIPNFNPQSEGGPTNKTLGGAQMMASIGEMRASFIVNQMTIGLKDVAKHQLALLRNIISNETELRTGQKVPKESILGDVSFNIKISNIFNYIRESSASENRLQQAINRRATQIPQFMVMRMRPLIVDYLRNNLKRENVSEYVDTKLLDALDEADIQSAIQAATQAQQQQMQPEQQGPQEQQVQNTQMIGGQNVV